jgi:hypothetical protein
MMIEVLLRGGTELEVVPDYVLGELLARGGVEGFRRSSGWVKVGQDPIREARIGTYSGPERRTRKKGSCLTCPQMIDGECGDCSCVEYRCSTRVFSLNCD